MIINLFCQKIEKNTDREKKKELTAWLKRQAATQL